MFAVLGVALGVVAGYVGGWLDRAIGWVADLLLALPGIIVLLMVLSVFPGNERRDDGRARRRSAARCCCG